MVGIEPLSTMFSEHELVNSFRNKLAQIEHLGLSLQHKIHPTTGCQNIYAAQKAYTRLYIFLKV